MTAAERARLLERTFAHGWRRYVKSNAAYYKGDPAECWCGLPRADAIHGETAAEREDYDPMTGSIRP